MSDINYDDLYTAFQTILRALSVRPTEEQIRLLVSVSFFLGIDNEMGARLGLPAPSDPP